MHDTIELLEAIGRDASLRHAPAGALAEMLVEAEATDALVKAVASGNTSHLGSEFGGVMMHTTQISQIPCHEDDDGDDDCDDDHDHDHDHGGHDDDCDDDEPAAPPSPSPDDRAP